VTTSTRTMVGQFSYSSSAPRWAWSDGMFALHGMTPGDVVPTRALFLSHVHPEDRARVELLLHACVVDGQPMVCDYRLVDLAGQTRSVTLTLAPTSRGTRPAAWWGSSSTTPTASSPRSPRV